MTQGTDLDPESAGDGARRLTVAGDAAQGAWTSAAARIEALHGGKPWGNDAAGQQFDQSYFQDGEGPGAGSFVGPGDKGGGTHVKRLAELGPGVTQMVNRTTTDDELVASWFRVGD